jgi:anti-sigma factor RsiW
MSWNCTQTEERLSDFLDNLLTPAEVRELNAHAASCADCTKLVSLVGGMLREVRSLEPVEVPARVVTAILDRTVGPRVATSGWQRWFSWMPSFVTPRIAMGTLTCAAAMLIFLSAIGLNPTRVKKGELSPANIYRAANRQTHLVFARGVKYVNDLRVVYEIQSRLRPEESPARERERQAPPPEPTPQEKSQGERDARPGHSSSRAATLYAFVVMQGVPRSER